MSVALREHICRSIRLPRNDEVLMGRAELLLPEDRLLVEAVLVRSQPTKTVAWMTGMPPRTVRRRIHRLSKRLTSRRFLNAARSLPYLDPDNARLARLHFCAGMSHRDLARELGVSVHTIRRRLDRIGAQIAMFTRTTAAPGRAVGN